MNKISLFLATIPVFIFILSNCGKNCKEYNKIDIDNPHAISYYSFGANSYWIYADSTGTIIDTFTVNSLISTYLDAKPKYWFSKCYRSEKVDCSISNEQMKNIEITAVLSLTSEKKERIRISYVPDFSSMEGSFILYNGDVEFIPDFEAYGGANFLSSYTVNSVTYNDVIKFTNYYNYHIYVAKNVGIIEMNLENATYYLKEYMIN